MAQKKPKDRHQDQVKAGNKTSLACTRIEQPYLLKSGSKKHEQPANAACFNQPPQRIIFMVLLHLGVSKEPKNRQQGKRAQAKPQRIKRKRPQMFQAHFFERKREAPEHCGKEQKTTGTQRRYSHNCRILSGYEVQTPFLRLRRFILSTVAGRG